VAFENTAQGEGQTRVIPYQINQAKSLKEIAVEVSSDETTLKEYNKWLKTDRVPEDKPYTILIPVGKLDMDFNKLVLSSSRASKAQPLPPSKENENQKISVNGIPAIRAKAGETISDLVKRSPISITAFLKYNDIAIDHPLEPGSLYLLGKKKTKSNEVNCKVKPGDDLWAISQRYGVRLKKLMKYNLLEENQRLVVGSWVWLNATKPKDQSFVVSQDEVAQLSENEAFDWYTKTPKTTEAIPLVTSTLVQKGAQDSVLRNQEPERSGSSLTKTHTVSPGETFYSIAKQYSLPVRDVLTWNDLTIQSSLKPGQVLKVAADETGPTHAQETVVGPELKALLHEVKSSDTLYSIARQYGVTIRNLLEWNNKKEFTLTVGEKLRIIQK
jgi:membrane-bound lytic murein transglycosylase D